MDKDDGNLHRRHGRGGGPVGEFWGDSTVTGALVTGATQDRQENLTETCLRRAAGLPVHLEVKDGRDPTETTGVGHSDRRGC